MLSDFLKGFAYLPKGLKLIGQPHLRRFVLIPLAINCLLFTIGIFVGAHYFGDLMSSWLPEDMAASLPSWLSWLSGLVHVVESILWVIFAAVVLVVLFFCFTVVANLIGAPFNGLLSEAVEAHLTGQKVEQSSDFKTLAGQIFKSIGSEIRKILYFVLCAIPLVILFWVPGIQILWLVYGAWMLAIEYVDYPMGNHDLMFSEQRHKLRQQRFLSLGFGSAVLIMTLIPVVNFFAMPAAVAGVTALWLDKFND